MISVHIADQLRGVYMDLTDLSETVSGDGVFYFWSIDVLLTNFYNKLYLCVCEDAGVSPMYNSSINLGRLLQSS